MTYDSQRHVTVLFGGEKATGYLGDTWEWDGVAGTWSLKATTGPSPRGYASMAYDPVRNVTVLFGGGDNGSQKNDTWEWNGATWSLMTPVGPTPLARAGHGMAYVSSCGVVMFGGGGSGGSYLGDTWVWDGIMWTQKSNTGPSVRTGPGMAYDSTRKALVLFGGFSIPSATGQKNDTWEWSGGASGGADLWMKDTVAPDLPEDFGVEPTISPLLYISRDIWVRDAADATVSGGTIC
ncbi:MAG TPA: kelch repeat-containing protein [Pyrinomonadaceae bacterium]